MQNEPTFTKGREPLVPSPKTEIPIRDLIAWGVDSFYTDKAQADSKTEEIAHRYNTHAALYAALEAYVEKCRTCSASGTITRFRPLPEGDREVECPECAKARAALALAARKQ